MSVALQTMQLGCIARLLLFDAWSETRSIVPRHNVPCQTAVFTVLWNLWRAFGVIAATTGAHLGDLETTRGSRLS